MHLSMGTDRSWAWQHLLLAVGNFKAHMPLFPEPLPPAPDSENLKRGETLEVPVPDGHLTLRVEDSATWRELSECIRGLAVPRTTTVLSAIWPGRHLIADWRALSAVAALVGARNGWAHTPVKPERTDQVRVDWETDSGTAGPPLNAPAERACIFSRSSVFFIRLATLCPGPHGLPMPRRSRSGSPGCHRRAVAGPTLSGATPISSQMRALVDFASGSATSSYFA